MFVSAQQDDFDLNEIFAEYFINEFDDPMNAYTSSMANYNTVNVPQGLPGQTPNPMAAVDAANAAAAAGAGGGIMHYNHGSSNTNNNNTSGVNLPTGGIKTAFHMGTTQPTKGVSEEPPAQKRAKQEAGLLAPAGGMPMPGGASGGVSLPVGVGIRLGGIGGIAPATATSAVRPAASGGVQTPYTMWATGMGLAPPAGGPGAPNAVSDQAVAERRQRNREHAKRSRVRKKFMLESLQEQVHQLQKENSDLRMLVQEHIPDRAVQIINECCTTSPLFTEGGGAEAAGGQSAAERKQTDLERSDFSLMQSLATGQKCFVLSDPKLPDNPIVFATPDFYTMTGYTAKEVLGRNCRFLQGPGTSQRHVEVIRKAVQSGSDCTVCLLNYKADGTPFWNQLFVAALRDSDNHIVNYVSICQDEIECGGQALTTT